jgi:hypothetical protein
MIFERYFIASRKKLVEGDEYDLAEVAYEYYTPLERAARVVTKELIARGQGYLYLAARYRMMPGTLVPERLAGEVEEPPPDWRFLVLEELLPGPPAPRETRRGYIPVSRELAEEIAAEAPGYYWRRRLNGPFIIFTVDPRTVSETPAGWMIYNVQYIPYGRRPRVTWAQWPKLPEIISIAEMDDDAPIDGAVAVRLLQRLE